MQRRRSRSRPERLLQAALRRRQIPFYKSASSLPGNPNIVLKMARIAVFVDEPFWHGWKLEKRKLTPPWLRKIQKVMERDAQVNQELIDQGWKVVRIWEQVAATQADKVAESLENLTTLVRLGHVLEGLWVG